MTRSNYLRTAAVSIDYALGLLMNVDHTGDVLDRLLALKRDLLALDATQEPWLPPTEKSMREAQKRVEVGS